MCGPHGLKFNQPVELRLPHCASVNPDSWSFALKSSDSPTGITIIILSFRNVPECLCLTCSLCNHVVLGSTAQHHELMYSKLALG